MSVARILISLTLAFMTLRSSDMRAATPNDFGPVVSHAVLCENALDDGIFYTYFKAAFGNPARQAGGGYWFKASATLWGLPVSQTIVSDQATSHVFIAVVIDADPEKLAQAILEQTGIPFTKDSTARYPLRIAPTGAVIAYEQKKSKLYCAVPSALLPDYPRWNAMRASLRGAQKAP